MSQLDTQTIQEHSWEGKRGHCKTALQPEPPVIELMWMFWGNFDDIILPLINKKLLSLNWGYICFFNVMLYYSHFQNASRTSLP